MNTLIEHDPDLIRALRARLAAEGLCGFLVPHADANQSEYLPPSAERLARLSGFTGSAGFAIVLANAAALFVDGRYTLQARDEIDADVFELHPLATVTPTDWLRERLHPGDKLGFDPWLFTPGRLETYRHVCRDRQANLLPLSTNPIDALWPNRPAPPESPIEVWDATYAPLTSRTKREKIGEDLTKAGAEAAIVCAGDSIAWAFNIRAADVPYTPLVLAFALLGANAKAKLFVDPFRVNADVRAHLGADVEVLDPDLLGAALDALGATKAGVRIAPSATPVWIVERLEKAGARILPGSDPCEAPKASKTSVEVDGMRRAHRRDGAALVRFLAWLDTHAPADGVTEMQAAAKLDALRAEHDLFRGPSFPTISGSGPNGAIVHYRVSAQSDRILGPGELYLVDSGGQYPDGTTDVTRTVAVGEPATDMAAEIKDRFTRVLKGHIAVTTQIFPKGTQGQELDVLARRALWEAGLDFEHGTGHGVGTYLGVHEGPQRISKRGPGAALVAGMVLSVEPGYYKEGAYGIRIENLVSVVEVPKPAGAEREMLGFAPLTLAPIDRRLIDTTLLNQIEIQWLNAYHVRVREELAALLDDMSRDWLDMATQPL